MKITDLDKYSEKQLRYVDWAAWILMIVGGVLLLVAAFNLGIGPRGMDLYIPLPAGDRIYLAHGMGRPVDGWWALMFGCSFLSLGGFLRFALHRSLDEEADIDE